jgi:tRNA-splicing ligase RtcB (3'-phosphate/5'-hydroxy nucleic acid ligase)
VEKINDRLLSWASVLDEKTRAQAELAATMPFVFPHLALMPDAHLGLGATVGSVIPTLETLMPAAVGVDIGCGMIAVRSQLTARDLANRSLAPLREAIEAAVPLSAGQQNERLTDTARVRLAELENVSDVDPDARHPALASTGSTATTTSASPSSTSARPSGSRERVPSRHGRGSPG